MSESEETVVLRLMPRLVMMQIVWILSGCGFMAGRDRPLPEIDPGRSVAAQSQATDGAIYAAGRDVALFEDLKARRIGDLLTIVLRESTSASKSASTKTKKDTSIDLPGPTLAGRAVTVNGKPILESSLEGTREFDGQGSSSQSNTLSGNITVTVVNRLPNGNLLVQGEKWLRLNQGDEFVRISGVIRPYDIQQDNTVTSDRVADARISYGGRGMVASANRAGWLARFFNSSWYPY
jgi:flagellar L-ring protein precursor FlgH